MHPSPDFAAWISARIAGMAGITPSTPTASILANFAAMAVPNPVTSAPIIPMVSTWDGITGCFDATTLDRLNHLTITDDLIAAVNAGDQVAQARYLTELVRAADITQAQADAAVALLAQTHPDPSWTPQITLARSLFGRDVDAGDIDFVRGS